MNCIEILPVKQEKKIERLAAYCRVSSDSLDQKNSFAAQIKYYSDYVKLNPQYALINRSQ